MGFFDKIIRAKEEHIDIDEVLNNLDVEEESLYENVDALVKSINLNGESDKDLIIEEIKKGNIILMNIGDLSKRNALKLREYIADIKKAVEMIDGDIACMTPERIIVTPSRVKIVKKRAGA